MTAEAKAKRDENEELRRMGLPSIEDDDAAYDFSAGTAERRDEPQELSGADDLAAERNRKFGTLMHDIRL